MTTISVIVGSTREGRFSETAGRWIHQELAERRGVETQLLDLRDYRMPFFDQPVPPATPGRAMYPDPEVQRWTHAVAAADGFVFVAPEYNHGVPGVLKNALDWVYPEWNRKAGAFVSYGGASGARAVEQLRLIAIELQMAPLRSAVHIPLPILMTHLQGGDARAALAELKVPATAMIDELLWWTEALSRARLRT